MSWCLPVSRARHLLIVIIVFFSLFDKGGSFWRRESNVITFYSVPQDLVELQVRNGIFFCKIESIGPTLPFVKCNVFICQINLARDRLEWRKVCLVGKTSPHG